MEKKICTESFENIQTLLKTLSERPNNEAMKNQDSSQAAESESWYGTDS